MALTLIIEQLLNGVQFGIMLFLMSAGLTLIFGVMGLINLAHGSLYMIGAFVCAFFATQLDSYWIGLALGLTAATIMGFLMEILILRRLYNRDHLDQVLATFALILIFSEGTRWVFGSFPLYLTPPDILNGTLALSFGVIYSKFRLAIIFAGIMVAIGLFLLIHKTKLGIQIRAGENDREMISVLGVNIRLLFTCVFALGAGMAGFAGAMVGVLQSVQVGMGEPVLILAFVVIVIGGIGSIKGSFVGSLIIGIADTMGRFLLPQLLGLVVDPSQANAIGSALATMLIYVLMAFVLIVKPNGLFRTANA